MKVLVNREIDKGVKGYVEWDGRDEEGNKVTNGVYFYRLEAGRYNSSKKMVYVR